MRTTRGFYSLFLIAVLTGPLPGLSEREEKSFSGWLQSATSESAQSYRQGQEAIGRGDWEGAIRAFEKVAEDGERADAALYWIAYAQNKKGDAVAALETLAELQTQYPRSRWVKDAKALEMEIQGPSPSPHPRPKPLPEDDLELKLMTLNSLMHADEDKAIPMLEELLRGDHPTKLKERALFVLAQSGSSRALEMVGEFARDETEPELQTKAIAYLGIHGRQESIELLAELYDRVKSPEAKKSILHSFMAADEQERVLEAAKQESDPEVRGSAIHWLGVMGAGNELGELYEKETSLDVKKKILHAFFIGDHTDRVLAVARNRSEPEELRLQAIHWLGASDANDTLWTLFQEESSLGVKKRILHGLFLSDGVDKLYQVARDASQPTELRKSAIHNLGMSKEAARPLLVQIYDSELTKELKAQILNSLFIQEAATELIDIARKETDRELKKQAVHWISLMDSEESKAFVLEILKK